MYLNSNCNSNFTEDLIERCPEEGDMEAQKEAERKRKEEEKIQREEERKKNEEMKEKRREKRGRVIEELIQTEKDFQQSLGLCIETFLSPNAERVRKSVECDVIRSCIFFSLIF